MRHQQLLQSAASAAAAAANLARCRPGGANPQIAAAGGLVHCLQLQVQPQQPAGPTPAGAHQLQWRQQQWLQQHGCTTTLGARLPAALTEPARHLAAHRRSYCADSSSGSSSSSDGSSSSSSADGGSPGAGSGGAGKDMGIVFTCQKCDTRSLKTFSRHSYEKGLVLIRCPGCQALHLIADHLGWFEDGGFKIDEYLAAQGQRVKRLRLDTHSSASSSQQHQQEPHAEVTAEDLVGWSKVQQLLSTVAGAAESSSQQQEGSGAGCHASGDSNSASHGDTGMQQGVAGSSSSSNSAGHDASGAAAATSEDASTPDPTAAAAAAAAVAAAQDGVVQLAPGDVDAWVRVQHSKQ